MWVWYNNFEQIHEAQRKWQKSCVKVTESSDGLLQRLKNMVCEEQNVWGGAATTTICSQRILLVVMLTHEKK